MKLRAAFALPTHLAQPPGPYVGSSCRLPAHHFWGLTHMGLAHFADQDCFTAIERARLPVIAAVHGCCVGGGVDLITACDIRICSEDATFCAKVGSATNPS